MSRQSPNASGVFADTFLTRAIARATAAASGIVATDADGAPAAYDNRLERPHALPSLSVGARQVTRVELYENGQPKAATVRLALHLLTPASSDAPAYAGSAGASDALAELVEALARDGFSFPGTAGAQQEGALGSAPVFETVLVPQITIPF